MLKLFCVVVGEGKPFSVKIDASETVDDLKQKITEKIDYKGRTMDLELYLALKNNAWLSDVDPDLTGLSKPVEGNTVFTSYTNDENNTLATRRLHQYFHDGNPPKESRFHVLVVVPPESKKRKHQELKWLDLHDLSPIVRLEKLPTVDELREHLLKPLPFKLELTDSELADRIFDANSEQIESEALQTPLNFMCRTFKSAPSAGASENIFVKGMDLALRSYGIKRIQQDRRQTCDLTVSLLIVACSCSVEKKRRGGQLIHRGQS
ncbi:hypothetical protein AC1031_020510 [Aphanomyces cochlioides]|nr:hypothetical protein AC1031_020510 [Aphanomyces cochlioides]